MSTTHNNSYARSLLDRLEQEYAKPYVTHSMSPGGPSPEESCKFLVPKPEAKISELFLREVRSTSDDVGDQVGSISTIGLGEKEQPSSVTAVEDARFGFAGADNRLFSLNIPAEGEAGGKNPLVSFDLEYDLDQPEMLTVSLMGLDKDNFVRTVRKSIVFPTSVIADLLSRRKATPEEIAAWQDTADED
jgi:hypothetical protein